MKKRQKKDKKENRIMVVDQGVGVLPDTMACCSIETLVLR